MTIEARFTVKGESDEKPFTIIEGEHEQLFLYYSELDGVEYKFLLNNNDGLLSLKDSTDNPFEESLEIVNERLTGLSTDWIENRAQGLENTATAIVKKNKPGYGPDDIFVENKPFSLKQIVDLIDEGDIELTPDFQRNFIWDKTRQSKLIESILLGLPLPSIYLSQYEDGKLTVVDGLQRLSTIREFMQNKLALTNLEYLEDCNNKKISELEKVLSPLRIRRFSQTQIMCFVIDYRSPSKLKYDLFRRLNTGGKPLNNQEIRNCLSRPEIQKVLKRMIELPSFGEATGHSVKDTRMDAREAALRFIYFREQYSINKPTGDYNGDMESTLDDFTDELNKRTPESLEHYISMYDNALKKAYHLFGDYCFRKVLPETLNGRKTPVNKLLMLCFTILLSNDSYDLNSIKRDVTFQNKLENLAKFIGNNDDIFRAITWSTNAKWNIETGLKQFKMFLDENL